MARRTGAVGGGGDQRITDAQLEALAVHSGYERAQARALVEEGEQGREKLRLMGQELVDKARLGTAEISSKDKQSRLAAAVALMESGAKTRAGTQSDRMDLYKALVGRPDLPAPVLAGTFKGGGMPELADALAAETAKLRSQFIQQQLPAILKAKSNEAREKTVKPVMESAFPGSFAEGLALAYPKGGQTPAATPSPATAPTAPVGEGTTDTDRIAAGLLQAAGYGPTGGGGGGTPGALESVYPSYPNVPEPRFVPQGAGSLEGSQYADLGGGRSRLVTPSGGTIGFNTPQTARRAGLLGNLIGSPVTTPALVAPAGINDLVAPAGAAMTAPLVKSTNVFDQYKDLLSRTEAPSSVAAVVPTTVLPSPTATITPPPQVAAALTPEQIEAERQRQLREAMLLQTQG